MKQRDFDVSATFYPAHGVADLNLQSAEARRVFRDLIVFTDNVPIDRARELIALARKKGLTVGEFA